uniref:Cysteine-rich DPF motif domain-containing protein 1 n=1 Tax=Meloidogyne incognita TaxID=6306 RepID=A0A914LLS1_MELIC
MGSKFAENAIIGTSSEYSSNSTDFFCVNCKLSVKCRYGKLELEKAGCKEECFYMRNPFEPPDFHKSQRDYAIDDFLVIGANCYICNQQICVDEECSLFYKNTYCLNCVWREKHSFPAELLSNVSKQRSKSKES